MTAVRLRKLRCAIYTRKSSEEGLEQEFNSLDAQREACEAYIASQKPEGWVLVRDRFDDGGWSGGTLERPALKRLLADIEEDRIDVVVVYKIDRLSRSLTDFTRLVEVFDGNAVTFVSVTQSFNTTTSMGRLTLNILLSFAQFEREVTGERIRDKIAASRKKGMWMGGTVPARLSRGKPQARHRQGRSRHRPHDLRAVRFETGSATALARALAAEGVTTRNGQAGRQGLPLQTAQQPRLYRAGRSQGQCLSRRARRDHPSGHLGQGSHHSGAGVSLPRCQHPRAHPGPSEGADLRR